MHLQYLKSLWKKLEKVGTQFLLDWCKRNADKIMSIANDLSNNKMATTLNIDTATHQDIESLVHE